ncbi:hypothetical protein Pla123a_14330 [Posidoniimonas polymericola]|uniref:DUF2961 domain-containing protein n=1 Tax=Posidoniimonas polymericola TaxID=2528002 RepID=A0A5C5YSM2_9BACT|nr:glycoside hydrolase family 172 protein [Posidoniimonas polymericola]TWT77637.1 hypothetical protein Pla123a_14330 [Posidoniimonas polymericola]
MRRVKHLAVLTLLASSSVAAARETVTTGTVIAEMTDLERLCRLPEVDYRTVQFTSYDRRSATPGGPEWFANSDGFGGAPQPPFLETLREPGHDGVGRYLMAEVDGPGVIVRTWTAAINGRLQVYLDGADQPVYDGPTERFLHHPYDSFLEGSGVAADVLDGTFYQRDAGYCPLPFAKGCRVVWEGNPKKTHFYYIQARKYLAPVDVQTFRPADLATFRDQIEAASRVLKGEPPASVAPTDETREIAALVVPGRSVTAVELDGASAITELVTQVKAMNERAALRGVVMSIAFDGHTSAQVQSPVGDFYAAAPGVNPYHSLPFVVEESGRMTSRFVMPYARSARISFKNLTDEPVVIAGHVKVAPREWDAERDLHFRARWRVMHDLSSETPVDIPFLVAGGAGRFVGAVSLMLNPSRGTHPNGSWWGEGDEKLFVDGDRFPAWYGTGSEDYYNYSWSAVDLFDYAYCGQNRNDGPANRGFVSNYRFHLIDDQPFRNRLAFYMELLMHDKVDGFSYACLAYHYARPGTIDDHRPITRRDVAEPRLPEGWKPKAYRATEEATFLEPQELAPPDAVYEEGEQWTGGDMLAWTPEDKGDTLELKVPISKAGRYQVRLGMALDARSGVVSATLDGEPFGFGGGEGKMELYSARRTMCRASASDRVELSEGEHTLTLTYEGGPAAGAPADGPRIGVDFLWLQP